MQVPQFATTETPISRTPVTCIPPDEEPGWQVVETLLEKRSELGQSSRVLVVLWMRESGLSFEEAKPPALPAVDASSKLPDKPDRVGCECEDPQPYTPARLPSPCRTCGGWVFAAYEAGAPGATTVA